MKQHNAAADKRDCWGSARERERMKARFNIRQRVNHAMVPSPMPSIQVEKASDEVISKYLLYIRRGDRSKFSTTFMDRHFTVVSALHSTRKHIFEKSDTLSETLSIATKFRGSKYSMSLKNHMESLSTFTLMEYAVWLGKYSIVSGMLHGGVNPCVRGSSSYRLDPSVNESGLNCQLQIAHQARHSQQQQELTEIGLKVLKRFFHSFPLRLSTYIVHRVVHLREDISEASNRNTRKKTRENEVEGIWSCKGETEEQEIPQGETATFHCPICNGTVCTDFRLTFRSCKHAFCEMCFWDDMLSNIDTATKREARDVVSCLVCGQKETCNDTSFNPNNTSRIDLHADISHLSPLEKAKLSLDKFHQLPANQRELKASTSKKKKMSEVDHLASNWLEAVLPSLGSTQDVRVDKFFVHVERNAISYVKGCLLAGVDLNKTNEYGQTALFVAAWRGYVEIVKLLLDHGANPSVPANGGSIISSTYSTACRRNDWNALGLYSNSSSRTVNAIERNGKIPESLLTEPSIQNEIRLSVLIPTSSKHPGAGSCFIDGAFSSDTIESLLELFHSIPVDSNQKKKKNAAPCSERSYFCDAEGSLRRLIGNAVTRAGLASTVIPTETVDDNNHPQLQALNILSQTESSSPTVLRVFPHMRFLNYASSGTVLPPHIDLCRINPFCRPSDNQNPKHRSTHTFILYLTDCQTGGDTNLLEEVTADGSAACLANVSPRRGRLLIFPHLTPHEGTEVVDVPKILLRGELQIKC